MGNGYEEACAVEKKAMLDLVPFLRDNIAFEGRFVVTSKGRLAPMLQKSVGDVLVNTDAETLWSVEIKSEARTTGNLFLETWSNSPRFTLGWMYTLNADILWYYFMDTGKLYSMSFPSLKRWAFYDRNKHGVAGKLYEYREVEQKKHAQLNITCGRIVPIVDIECAIGMKTWHVASNELVKDAKPPKQQSLFGGDKAA